MATKNIVPRADSEGKLGTPSKFWLSAYLDGLNLGNAAASNLVFTPSTGDTVTFAAGTNGTLTITTVDTAAAAANVGFVVDGTFDIDAAGAVTIDGSAITIGGDSDVAIDIDSSTLDIDASGAITLDGVGLAVGSSGAASLITSGAASDIVVTTVHTAGMAFQLNANTNAASEVEINAGILDLNVTGVSTLNTTGLTITGPTLQLGNFTTGADDTGVDVRFFSATASEGILYDASEDELGLLLTTKLKFHDIGGGEEIFASANGHLEINAGTTLDITAPTIDVNGTMDVSGAFTNGSTLVSTGKITADAGIDIDNINIDGTTIALSSGHLTLDLAAQLIIDADDEGSITLKNSGTSYGLISNASEHFKFKSVISDGDIIFQGNDGGSEITALTLDMSAAGAATFSGDVGILKSSPVSFLRSSGSITTGSRGDFSWYNSADSTVALIRALAVTDNVGTQLDFYTRPAGGDLTKSLTITSGGNIAMPRAYNDTSSTVLYVDSTITGGASTYQGSLLLQAGGDGSASYGGSMVLYGHAHASLPGTALIGLSAISGSKFTINNYGAGGGDELFKVERDNNNATVSLGNLVIGTPGKGIDFSATANGGTSTPNELFDDYEEGNFTPAFTGVNTSGTARGFYTKIGDTVHAHATITSVSVSDGNQVKISLPFTRIAYTDSAHNGGGSVGYTTLTVDELAVAPSNNEASCVLYKDTPSASVTRSDMSGKRIDFSITYQTAT
tara:strand:+ start:1005 stop:3206 length:2202 start_codon:yes stop_codon:yes gene_type:complete